MQDEDDGLRSHHFLVPQCYAANAGPRFVDLELHTIIEIN